MHSRPTRHPLVAEVLDAFAAHRYAEAEHWVNQGLEADPTNPDLNAAMALLCLWTQRETEALEFAVAGADSCEFPHAAQWCMDYWHCRRQMSVRVGAKDPVGLAALESCIDQSWSPSPTVGIGLSATLIVKNEEAHLERCLRSLQGIVDEFVVIDTGSTDRTVAIAESFGAKIGFFAWEDHFGRARNAALELATQPWCLWIDADEELDANSAGMLREALMRPQFGGYQIPILNLRDSGSESDAYQHAPLRLFRRHPEIRFEGRIHEQIVGGILRLGMQTATLHGALIRHYGYTESLVNERNKVERTLAMLQQAIEEEPDFSFHYYNLANTYAVGHRWHEVEAPARRAIKLLERQASYGSGCYEVLTTSLLAQGRYEDALETIAESERTGWYSIIQQYQAGEALRHLDRWEEALAANQRCLAMDMGTHATGDFSVPRVKRHLQAARIANALGNYGFALEQTAIALERQPTCATATGLRAIALAKTGATEEALVLLESIFDDALEGPSALWIAAQIWAVRHEWPRVDALLERRWALGGMDSAIAELWRDAASHLGKLPAITDRTAAFPPSSAERLRRAEYEPNDASALETFSALIRENPLDSEPMFHLGDRLYRMAQYPLAAQTYAQALEIRPDHAEGWFVLGNAMAQLGHREQALAAYARCLAIQPDHAGAEHNRALLDAEAA